MRLSLLILIEQAHRIGNPLFGIVIPAVILLVAFVVTWLLYKHFAK